MVKNLLANAGDEGDAGWIPGWRRSAREGDGNPLQYSCLENPMERGAWGATVHGGTNESDMTYRLGTCMHLHFEFLKQLTSCASLIFLKVLIS